MNYAHAGEIIRLLDSIDTTLRKMLAHQCECNKVTNVYNEQIDAKELIATIRNAVRREMRG